MKPGKFIVFDGIEGGGKSSQLREAKAFLEHLGVKVRTSREPGGTPFAEEIRSLLLAQRNEPVDSMAELCLFFAARAQHINKIIKPALEAGEWMLCDRFTSATKAYQAWGRGLPLSQIETLESLVQEEFRPDMTFIFDLSWDISQIRVVKRGALDRFEQEQREFFERVRSGYLEQAKADPLRFTVIDAEPAAEDVSKRLCANLHQIYTEWAISGRAQIGPRP